MGKFKYTTMDLHRYTDDLLPIQEVELRVCGQDSVLEQEILVMEELLGQVRPQQDHK